MKFIVKKKNWRREVKKGSPIYIKTWKTVL